MDARLADNEMEVLIHLAAAADVFGGLDRQHQAEEGEFCQAIHQAQALIMARPIARQYGWVEEESNGD